MSFKAYLKQLGLPGAISAMSLLAGWIAISLLLSGELRASVIFAVFAFVLDTLDGYVARKQNRVSELGRQLDSMVDLINYSTYSALLTARVLLPDNVGMMVAYLILLFGVLRLIRFNTEGYVEKSGQRYYRGVVTCHLSLAAVLFLLADQVVAIPSVLMAITLGLLAVLQLSNFKTRKSGTLFLWYMLSVVIIVGAVVWLR